MKHNIEPKLGVHLLETITRGMYSQPLHSIREYVQNAFDSIRDARSKGILRDTEGTIRILLDPAGRSLSIEDDGTGLTPEEAVVWLLDIGRSEKAVDDRKSRQHAGFRGIGRMAGISYCDVLKFETSNGDGKVCHVNFDALRINSLTRPGQTPMSISDAVGSSVTVTEKAIEPGRRFFTVVMENVAEGTGFLDNATMKEYLSEVAPVAYDPQQWSFREEIRAMAERADSLESLNTVRLVICDSDGNEQMEVRRGYCDTFEATSRNKKRKVTVKEVRCLPTGDNLGTGWWGWLAMHSREAKLGDVPFAGLRIRMHNIAVGDERILRRLFKTPHLALWCFGEIHITDFRAVPNAQRDTFEPSKLWSQIEEELRLEVKDIEKMCRKKSKDRSNAKRRKLEEPAPTKNDNTEPSETKKVQPTIEPIEGAGNSDSESGKRSLDSSSGHAPAYQSTMTQKSSIMSETGVDGSGECDGNTGVSGHHPMSNDPSTKPGVGGPPMAERPTRCSESRHDGVENEDEILNSLDSQARGCFDQILPVLQEYFDEARVTRLAKGILTVLRHESEVPSNGC